MKNGTLYPILYRLEEEELVDSTWSMAKDKELSKKYYKITEKGKVVLAETIKLWCDMSENVNNILEV